MTKPHSTVRIIGGSLRGSRIEVPPISGLRPTPDRVRETLFNWLAPVIEGARCLDLFAGSGALGIEALSRGAAQVTFVESDGVALASLQATLVRLHAVAADVVARDAMAFLAGPPAPYDVVFIDPPFDAALWQPAIDALASGWLKPGAIVHVESPLGQALKVPAPWKLHRQGHAGAVAQRLYRID